MFFHFMGPLLCRLLCGQNGSSQPQEGKGSPDKSRGSRTVNSGGQLRSKLGVSNPPTDPLVFLLHLEKDKLRFKWFY